jgi:predicted kinase
MGVPASGKTTLARAIAGHLGLVHLSSDRVRQRPVGMRPGAHAQADDERGLYGRAQSRRTYAQLRRLAARWLRRGQSVVLDAPYCHPAERTLVRQVARRVGARLLVILCTADEAILRGRLAARAATAPPNVWLPFASSFPDPGEIDSVLVVDSSLPAEDGVERVLSELGAAWSGPLAVERALTA